MFGTVLFRLCMRVASQRDLCGRSYLSLRSRQGLIEKFLAQAGSPIPSLKC